MGQPTTYGSRWMSIDEGDTAVRYASNGRGGNAAVIRITAGDNATWDEDTLTLTETGAFTNYSPAADDKDLLSVTSGTGATVGKYPIVSKTDNNSIVLARSISTTGRDLVAGDDIVCAVLEGEALADEGVLSGFLVATIDGTNDGTLTIETMDGATVLFLLTVDGTKLSPVPIPFGPRGAAIDESDGWCAKYAVAGGGTGDITLWFNKVR